MEGRPGASVDASYLRFALRAYTREARQRHRTPRAQSTTWDPPRRLLVFDTETETGPGQGLLFGSARGYRYRDGALDLLGELLFHPDDLASRNPAGYETLREYGYQQGLPLLSRAEFCEQGLWRLGFKARAWIVGFNLPFDLSRLALDHGSAQERYYGGFSFRLWPQVLVDGTFWENRFRPRLLVKSLDSKRAFIRFAKPAKLDWVDMIPDDTPGRPDEKFSFPGRFLDLRTLVFALTGESHSLASACDLYGIADAKLPVAQHGVITPENLDYNRRDVESTASLAERALAEYARHPIALLPTSAYSPASVGKAYLDAMGVQQLRTRERRFSGKRHGQAMTGYYGGRAETRLRKTLVPVVTVDFLSNYPTGNALMHLWRLVSASRITAKAATAETRAFLDRLTLDACFDPATWRQLPVLCLVEPDGDVLPVRCDYAENGSWQIGLNPLTSSIPLWYPLPDLVSSWLLTGRAPRILRAFRLVPDGRQEGLRPVQLRGEVEIDPIDGDPFRRLIEERKRLDRRTALPKRERESLERSFKVVANSIGYGVFAEISRTDTGSRTHDVNVYGLGDPFLVKASAVEEPGRYSFPPIAALVTASGRLQLALLERLVTDQGGTYVYCDTDSMAIVASQHGGPVPCHTRDGDTVHALSWEQVDQIVKRFELLNPYDREAIPDSILQIEKRNREDDGEGPRRQLYVYSISAKRYALATQDEHGSLSVVKRSEHGLGHLRNPVSTDPEDRDWYTPFWHATLNPDHAEPSPDWLERPAVSQIAASTPNVLSVFDTYNTGLPYHQRIKPFNFLLAAYVAPFSHPAGYPHERFQLIAPYEPNPAEWERIEWIDRYSGDRFPVHTQGPPSPDSVKLRTYRDVQDRYLRHPEPKSLGPDGKRCDGDTTGLLQRRPVTAVAPIYIGKESNNLEERQAGLIHSPDEAYSIYRDPGIDTWTDLILPALRRFPLA